MHIMPTLNTRIDGIAASLLVDPTASDAFGSGVAPWGWWPNEVLVADPLPGPTDAPLIGDPFAQPLGGDLPPDPLGVRYPPLSGDPRIDGVLLGRAWNALQITYSFPDSPYDYENPYGAYNEPWSAGAASVWPTQQLIFRAILEGQPGGASVMRYGSVESFTGLDFIDNGSNTADIRIAISPFADPTAYAYYPAEAGYGGDIWFGTRIEFRNPVLGDWGYLAHLHETIHALGLKGGHAVGPLGTPALPYEWDSLEFTVGTYRSFVGAPTDGYRNETYGYPQTLMMLDIAALQYLYGADWGTNATDTTYRWNTATGEMTVNGVAQGRPGANRVFLTIWDGGGTDTYDMSNYAGGVTIDLRAGSWSTTSQEQRARLNAYDGYVLAQGTVYNALQVGGSDQSLIENAIGGGGADVIRGNQVANHLYGGYGNDTLDGAGGNDTLDGGFGIDSLVGGAGDDVFIIATAASCVVELPGGGIDEVISKVSLNLAAEVEKLTLIGAASVNANGNELANTMTGNGVANRLNGFAGDDSLFGGDGNDTLDGGGGTDRMTGGAGDDTYIVNAGTDRVVELAGGGIDHVLSTATFILPAWVEMLTLTGNAAIGGDGNALGNIMVGNGGANSLRGFGGNDTLDGGGGHDTLDGGLGADSMIGGLGNDTYVMNAAADRVVELADGGIDHVLSSASINLPAEVEKLTLTGAAAINANGNVLANTITGNGAANWLNGAGGNDAMDGAAGADTLDGGGGNDTLAGGAGDDVLAGNVGIDRLTGGDGADRFHFGAPTQGYDRITDFAPGDMIEISRAGFGNLLPLGTLDPASLAIGSGFATQAAPQLLYNATSGVLRWDADGTGAVASVVMAVLDGAPGLAATDIQVVA